MAIQEADEAELAARGAGAGLSGRLRISAAPTSARLHVIPRLPRFLNAHPDLDVDVVLDDRTIDLIAEGIDISLRMGTLADASVVARNQPRRVAPVWPPPSIWHEPGTPRVPADLSNHETIVYSQSSDVWNFRRNGDRSLRADARSARFSG